MIHDPLALHAVAIKEQEFYTKSVTPSKYVPSSPASLSSTA